MVYDLDKADQDEIYYYPITIDGKIVMVLSVMGTSEGYSLSVSEEMVKELNELEYTKNRYIFLKSGENLVAENSHNDVCVKGKKTYKISQFCKNSYSKKVNTVVESMKKYVKCDVQKQKKNPVEKYTPQFSTSTSAYKRLALYNARGQGYYAIAYNVLLNKQASWSKIQSNIAAKKPIAASATSTIGGHAVTIYGYRWVGTSQYVILWNSGLNSGKGGTQIVYYKPTVTFAYAGTTFTWYRTLMYK